MKNPFALTRRPAVAMKTSPGVDTGDALDNQFPAPPNPLSFAVPSAQDQWLMWLRRIDQISVIDEGSATLLQPEIDAETRLYVDQILARSEPLRGLHNNAVAESQARLTAAEVERSQSAARLELLEAQEHVYTEELGAVTTSTTHVRKSASSYDPHEDVAAGTGATSRADSMRRLTAALIPVGIGLDAVLGHVAFNRLLEGSELTSWFAAIGVALFTASLAHWAGRLWTGGARLGASVVALVWLTAVGCLSVVRYHASAAPPSASGSLSGAGTENVLVSTAPLPWVGAVLMAIVFLLTAGVAFIAGAHETPLISARKKALAELPAARARARQADAALERARQLHATHARALSSTDLTIARAIKAQLDTSEWIAARAALALREKLGAVEADFTLQLTPKEGLSPEAVQLLSLLEAKAPYSDEADGRASDLKAA